MLIKFYILNTTIYKLEIVNCKIEVYLQINKYSNILF